LQHPLDKRIGSNILKAESKSEQNNPKHWRAKYFLPFQRWEVALLFKVDLPLRLKNQCAKGFKLGTCPHKCVQWRGIGFYGSCLRALQSDSELAWPVLQALMAKMKLQVMKVPVACPVAGPE
jgi:hypothetical protein